MQKLFHIKNYIQPSLATLFGLGFLICIVHKAAHTSFTHDESYTYLHYVHQSFMDIISFKTPYLNNHILNSVCMKYSEYFFGSTELTLRLPSIIAFIIYNIFGILLLNRYCPKMLLPFYLLLLLNPYLLDFFALARGYALSIAFIIMSISYISAYFTSNKTRHLILFNLAAFLAVMSNFSALNYYAAALLVYNIILVINSTCELSNKKPTYRFYDRNKINFISVILSGLVLYEPLRRISKMKLLDFGGKNGFLEDTVGSVIYDLFYEMNVTDLYLIIIKIIVVIIFISTLVLIVIKVLQKDATFFKENGPLVFTNLVILSLITFTYLQYFLIGNDFNTHRFALFFYPLFIINFIFLLNYIYQVRFKKVALSISYLCAFLLMLNLYNNHSFSYYKDWKWDQDTKFVMHKMILEHDNVADKKTRLGVNWLLEPSTNFYRYIWNIRWMNPTHRQGISIYDDYALLFKSDPEFEALNSKSVLYVNDQTGLVLVKNRD